MRPKIKLNDAWDSIPLGAVDHVIEFFEGKLQAAHPLHAFKLFPLAKCCRRERYLVEEEEPSDNLWLLDLERKRRIKGKTCYDFRRIETQEEFDAIMRADYEAWVQMMKDAGAWNDD